MQDTDKLSEINFVEKNKVQAILEEAKDACIGDYLEAIEHMVIGVNPIEIIKYGEYYWDYDNERGAHMGYSGKIEDNNGIIIYYNDDEKTTLEEYILTSFYAYDETF